MRTSSWFVGLSSVGSLPRTCSSSRSAVMSQETDHCARWRRNNCVQDRSSNNNWSSFEIVWKGGRHRTHLTAMNNSRAVVSCVYQRPRKRIHVRLTNTLLIIRERMQSRFLRFLFLENLLRDTCSISKVGLKLCTVPVGLWLVSASTCSRGYSAVGCNRAFQTNSLRKEDDDDLHTRVSCTILT